MLTDFKQETHFETNINTIAPGNKNIVFEIVDDVDEFLKNEKNKNTEDDIHLQFILLHFWTFKTRSYSALS